MASNRQRYVTALFGLDAVIRRVPADAWGNQSPCEGWTARDVVDHNLFILRMVEAMAAGRDVAVPRSADDGLFPAPVEGFSLASWLSFDTMDGDADPVEVWSSAFATLLAALDTVEPSEVKARSLFGHETLDEYLAWVFYDPIVHTWDIAMAAALDPVVDTALTAEALTYIEAHEVTLRQPMVLGDPIETTSQDPLEQLLAFCGRDPHFDPAE